MMWLGVAVVAVSFISGAEDEGEFAAAFSRLLSAFAREKVALQEVGRLSSQAGETISSLF